MSNPEDPNDSPSLFERQLAALRNSLEAAPASLSVDALMPVLVPASFFARGNWVGPHEEVGIDGVGLTWAIEQPEQTMRYLDHGLAKYWSDQGIDWRERAFDHLGDRSQSTFATGSFPRDDGSGTPFALVFMHGDGFGPSRLLFDESISEFFPEGYRIAMPEMSCGIAVSATASEAELARIRDIVDHCYRNGTRPLVPGFHPPLLVD
jgi:hypothetical protein